MASTDASVQQQSSGAIDQREAIRLADSLLSDSLMKKSGVEALMSGDPSQSDRRVTTFRGRLLLDQLLARGASARLGDASAVDEAGAREVASRLLNFAVSYGPAKAGGAPRVQRLFAQCKHVLEEKLVRSAADDVDGSDAEDDEDDAPPSIDASSSGASSGAAAAEKPKAAARKTELVRMRRNNMFVVRAEEERKMQTGRRVFDPAARYFWVYAGDPFWSQVKLVLLVVAILAGCLYPLWPTWVRIAVWYVAVTVLLAIVGFTVLQLLIFAVVWVAGYEFWLLPNLWADVPVWELLKPVYTFKQSGPGARWMRLGVVGLLAAVAYYFATAPAGELDLFLDQQKQFVNDLYAGTLLTDGSSAGKAGGQAKDRYAGMGYGKKHGGVNVPDISEFERMFEEEDAKESKKEGAAGEGAGEGEAAPPSAEETAAMAEAATARAAEPDLDALLASHDEDTAATGEEASQM